MILNTIKYSFATATHTPICVLGGGTASLNFTAQLGRRSGVLKNQIRIFDPSKIHHYQPAWTMVGGGICDIKTTSRQQTQVFNKDLHFTSLEAVKVIPEQNKIITNDNSEWTYDHLVVATGNRCDFTAIKGLKEALDDPNCPVGSIYWRDYAEKFNQLAAKIRGGKVIFTEPQMPIKCGGAPQKVLYLNEERFRTNGVRQNIQLEFRKTSPVLFGVPKYAESLAKVIKEKNIDLKLKSKLVEVRGKERIAVFENQDTKELTETKFDLLHAVPPQSPPPFIAQSGLGDAAGYCEVDKHTMIHTKFNNIWSLGDSSSLPTSKTAAAIMTQTPLLVDNLLHVWKNKGSINTLPQKYMGYTSCPIFTGDKKLILAEFKYDGVVDETFYVSQDQPHYTFYYLKKYFFPYAYWNFMSKGVWYGREGFLPVLTRAFTGVA